MNIQIITALVGGIVGGIISGAVATYLDKRREARALKNHRQILITGILDDLERSIDLYSKLEDNFSDKGYIDFLIINALNNSRGSYHNYRGDVRIFSDDTLRKDIFKYYLDSDELIGNLNFLQNQNLNILNKFDDAVISLKREETNLAHNEAEDNVRKYMSKDISRLRSNDNLIAKDVIMLKYFKILAIKLMDDLQKEIIKKL